MVEQVLIAASVMGLLFVAATGVAAFVVVRGVRRRYRTMRARLRSVGSVPSDLSSLLHHSGSVAAASLGSVGWWATQNRRHRMWRAVTSAEHAVEIARRADVAVGELPMLGWRLHAAANEVDAVLRAGGRMGSLRAQDRADCDRIVAAAGDLQAAALATLRADSHADAHSVASAVQMEAAALAAGMRAARG